MISEKEINQAFDMREKTFWELAKAEDNMTETAEGLQDFKEGSKAALAVQERLKAMQPKLNELKRKYTIACWQVERIQVLTRLAEK